MEKKVVKIGTILSRKSSKDPSWLAMCNVYIRNELPTGLPARFNGIQHKGDILPIRTCGDFYVSFVYRYCHEPSTCRIVPWIFRQSIISTIDNSTNFYQKLYDVDVYNVFQKLFDLFSNHLLSIYLLGLYSPLNACAQFCGVHRLSTRLMVVNVHYVPAFLDVFSGILVYWWVVFIADQSAQIS